jgi:hypothetical protein
MWFWLWLVVRGKKIRKVMYVLKSRLWVPSNQPSESGKDPSSAGSHVVKRRGHGS